MSCSVCFVAVSMMSCAALMPALSQCLELFSRSFSSVSFFFSFILLKVSLVDRICWSGSRKYFTVNRDTLWPLMLRIWKLYHCLSLLSIHWLHLHLVCSFQQSLLYYSQTHLSLQLPFYVEAQSSFYNICQMWILGVSIWCLGLEHVSPVMIHSGFLVWFFNVHMM